jgi:class 3 adenylate cyclase
VQLRDALDRYGHEHDLAISMKAGVDTGTVTVGLIGDSRLVYDLWGEAVDRATALSRVAEPGSILVTRAARDRTTLNTAQKDVPGLGEITVYELITSQGSGVSA